MSTKIRMFPAPMSRRNLSGAMALALGLSGLAGCGVAPADPSEGEGAAQAPANLVTSVNVAGGAQVDFYEPEPGRLMAIASGEIPEVGERPSAVSFYEALSQRSAPPALVQAQQRADLARRLRPAPQVPAAAPVIVEAQPDPGRQRVQVSEGIGASSHALSAASFQASYCPAGTYNFFICWTNRTGTASYTINSVDWMHVHINAYQGQVLRSIYYKNTWGTWILLSSINATGVNTVYNWTTTDNDSYKVEVTQATGDGYHLAIHGET